MIAQTEVPADTDPAGDLLANTPMLTPALSLSCYRFPVQDIGPDRSGWSRWKKRTVEAGTVPHFILGFRNAEDEVRFTELSTVTAQLVQRLIDQDPAQAVTGREILWQLAADSGHPDPQRFMLYGAATLLELRAHGAIVGVRRSPSPSNEPRRGT